MQRLQPTDDDRLEALRKILSHERNEALARVREFRKEQEEDVSPLPSDELDAARSLADVETHASLIERAEYRLKAIDAAFSRIERGCYGICDECGENIPIDRLKVLPFAGYCVDCQAKRNRQLRPGEGSIDEPSRHLWAVPEEVDESMEKEEEVTQPEEQLAVHDQRPLGPEVGEFEQLPPVPTARRRGRVKRRDRGES